VTHRCKESLTKLNDPSRHPPRRTATSLSISSQPKGAMPDFPNREASYATRIRSFST
jgi:hypothetical protein